MGPFLTITRLTTTASFAPITNQSRALSTTHSLTNAVPPTRRTVPPPLTPTHRVKPLHVRTTPPDRPVLSHSDPHHLTCQHGITQHHTYLVTTQPLSTPVPNQPTCPTVSHQHLPSSCDYPTLPASRDLPTHHNGHTGIDNMACT